MEIPAKIKGAWLWSHVIPQLVGEINFEKLLELGTIVKHKDRTAVYQSLRASLRKIQWTKISGLKAISIEQDIKNRQKPNVLVLDPLGITDHSLSVTDCLIHTKSALDSLGIFLNDLLDLKVKDGKYPDLKHPFFRQQIIDKDPIIGPVIKNLGPWFADLQDLRDEWIHRTSIEDSILIGPSEVGVLPLPKKVQAEQKKSLSPKNFWSTSEFVKFHYQNFVHLFNIVVQRCIQIEKVGLEQVPSPNPSELSLIALFPIRLTQNMVAKRITLSNWTLSGYYKRLSELHQKFDFRAGAKSKLEGSEYNELTDLCKGLWGYVSRTFGIPAKTPNIKVIFVPETSFKQFLNSKRIPETIKKRMATTIQKGSLDVEGKQEHYFIVIQKSRIKKAKRFFTSYLRKSQNTSETILRLLIHEIIGIYLDVTGKKQLDAAKQIIEEELNIYNEIKTDHPEYFTKKTNENLLKNLKKIPDN